MKESLSALLDGELSPSELDQVLNELERDPALREHFSRQCLARDSRMGTRIRTPQVDFANRVLAALHNEPQEAAVVVPFGDRARRFPWRTAVGLAAAAALGAVAVLVVRPQAPGGVAVSQSAALSPADVMPVAAKEPEPVETQYSELDDENARQLRNYLMAYSQSGGQQGVRSMLGHARYATYAGDSRPAPAAAEPQPEPRR